jgi:hypothetical protein
MFEFFAAMGLVAEVVGELAGLAIVMVFFGGLMVALIKEF